MRFSQRIGKKPLKELLQIDSIDSDLKNRLWNCILESFFNKLKANSLDLENTPKFQICSYIWKEFFNETIDYFPRSPINGSRSISEFIRYLRDWFFETEWFNIYDLIELLCEIDNKANTNLNFHTICNKALEKEVSGYRIIHNKVVQLTKEEEIEAIEQAIINTNKWHSVNTHIETAISSLASKTDPNYRNSVKESISAVESLCKIITGDSKSTLGKALIEIEKKHKIHGSLKSAFSAIYGYTSDSGGIRHALLEDDNNIDADEAKFMLISCSAFINYLIAKSS